MAITVSDVKDGFSTTVPDSEITALITFVDTADACFTANGVAVNTQDILKLYAVRHMLIMQANSGRGEVSSEGAPSGARRSFATWRSGDGLKASRYGSLLDQLDRYGCLSGLLSQDVGVSFSSVGPTRERGTGRT